VKTAASERVIPLPPAAALVLAAWAKAADPAQEYVFPGRTQPIEDARHDWAVWKAALEQAGVPHVPLHGARGSAASILRAMGVPERWIADVLGHATVHVTQEHYLHSDDAQRLDALTRLAGQLGLASGEARPPGGPAASEPLALTGS
jgi:integrase